MIRLSIRSPPRLGFVDGDVSFWRPGAEDWASAQVNTALAAGDSLYAGDGGNFELQSGPRALVRGGANTELRLERRGGGSPPAHEPAAPPQQHDQHPQHAKKQGEGSP